jgi:hypothetical protein
MKVKRNMTMDHQSGAPRVADVSRRPFRRALMMLVFLCGALMSLLSLAPASFGEATTTGPPQFANPLAVSEVRATHVVLFTASTGNVEKSVRLSVELSSTGANGPWTQVESQTCPPSKESEECQFAPIFQHLKFGTKYYARAELSDALGSAESTTSFTTPGASAPEIVPPYVFDENGEVEALRPVPILSGGEEIGPTFAEFQAEIQSNGAETEYHFEYATTEAALEEGKGVPVSGSAGSITEAEDFAEPVGHLTGLSPETQYYVRVVASNVKGVAKRTRQFETTPASPRAMSGESNDITEISARLNGSVVPDSSETQWHFEYATAEGGPYIPATGASGTIDAAEADQRFHGVTGILNGLNPSTTYYLRLFAENANGHTTSTVTHFETAGPPLAVTDATHGIHGETMRALGSVVPHGYDTHYDFQYVSQKDFEAEGFANAQTTPELDAGGGGGTEGSGVFNSVLAGADLPGLQAGETYHYRIVASSVAPGDPEIDGDEQVLTVSAAAGGEEEEACPNQAFRTGPSALLPDCRAYEQVTPVEKGGSQDIYGYGGTINATTVGEDGEHVGVRTLAKWGASAGDFWTDYVFGRTPGGWRMTSVTPQPHAGEETYEAEIFNANLTEVGALSYTETQLERLGPELHLGVGATGGPYTPAKSASSDGSVIGHVSLEWAGASEDFKTLVLRSKDYELIGDPTGTSAGYDLYEYTRGQLRQLNVLTGGATIGSCGAAMVYGGLEGRNGSVQYVRNARHAVSSDGSRVFFYAGAPGECPTAEELRVVGPQGGPHTDLYMRTDGTETLDIGAYVFRGANAEGTELLLEHEKGETHEVYLYDVATRAATHLFSLPKSLEAGISTEGSNAVLSADFTALYFSSQAQLTAAAPSGSLRKSAANFYRYDFATHALSYLFTAGGEGGVGGGIYATPDGRDLYFASIGVAGLPGGAPGQDQVYRYDNDEGVVQCMSCASAFDPEPTLSSIFVESGGEPLRAAQPSMRVGSDNGNYVFFDTPDELVPQDVDGEEEPNALITSYTYSRSSDVYEWRRDGVNGCKHVQGCLALITDGSGGVRNVLLGTDSSGENVFFATHSQLAPSDEDSAGDVYDARVDGGFPSPPALPVECENGACSTPPSAPLDATPSSLTFSGSGNLTPVAPASGKAKSPKKAKKKMKKKVKSKKRKSEAKRRARNAEGKRRGK